MNGQRKLRSGVSFEPAVIEQIDAHVKKLAELSVDRSEIVNAILADYFDYNGSPEDVRKLVKRKRESVSE